MFIEIKKNMKKNLIYITLFLSGLLLGLFILSNSNYLSYFENDSINADYNYIASSNPEVDRKIDFINSASSMIGKDIIISGLVKVAYKNKFNELVIIIKDENIPFEVNCTLLKSDEQIKQALKLGESIILKGKFTSLDEYIVLENCNIIKRLEVIN